MSEVKVSVIMPVYNVSKYLEETLGYVLNQTLKEIELICVDDGSTDASYEILKRNAENDKRMVVLQQQNQYAGVARNNGLAIAKGKYVIFWDSDDIFKEDALEKLYLKAEQDHAEITVCAANKYDEAHNEIVLTNTYLVKDRLPEKIPFSREEIGKYIFNFAGNVPWNKLYLRSFVNKHKLQFESRRQANDAYFVMMAFYYAKSISIVEDFCVNYRISTGNSTTDKASAVPLSSCEAYEVVLDSLKKTGEYEGDLKQSFLNKALNGFTYSLSVQSSFEAYKKVYNYVKDRLFDEFEISKMDEDYFYNKNVYGEYQDVMKRTAEEYLVHKLKNTSEEMKLKNSRIRILKERREELKVRRDELKQEREKLKTELSESKKIIKQQKAVLDSKTVRYALKIKDILSLNRKRKRS